MRKAFNLLSAKLAMAIVLLGVSTGFGNDSKTELKAELSEADFEQLAPKLQLRGGMWDLPWQVSITEARRVALREQKLIFMIVNTGNCIGFV